MSGRNRGVSIFSAGGTLHRAFVIALVGSSVGLATPVHAQTNAAGRPAAQTALASSAPADSSAAAQASVPDSFPALDDGTLDIWRRTQQHTAILRVQIDEAKAESDLQTLKNGLSRLKQGLPAEPNAGTQAQQGFPMQPGMNLQQGPISPSMNTPVPETRVAESKAKPRGMAPPQILAVFGTGSKLLASLRYESGLQIDVGAGDRIDGDFVVRSISANGVVLTRGGSTFPLRIYAGSSESPSNVAQGTSELMGAGMAAQPPAFGARPLFGMGR